MSTWHEPYFTNKKANTHTSRTDKTYACVHVSRIQAYKPNQSMVLSVLIILDLFFFFPVTLISSFRVLQLHSKTQNKNQASNGNFAIISN